MTNFVTPRRNLAHIAKSTTPEASQTKGPDLHKLGGRSKTHQSRRAKLHVLEDKSNPPKLAPAPK